MAGMGQRKLSTTFIVSAELAIVAGIIFAFYVVPGSIRASIFWTVAAIFFLATNYRLFFVKKQN